MPRQSEIRKMAKARGISAKAMSAQVFGHMRSMGWRPLKAGGPTKAWKKHQR